MQIKLQVVSCHSSFSQALSDCIKLHLTSESHLAHFYVNSVDNRFRMTSATISALYFVAKAFPHCSKWKFFSADFSFLFAFFFRVLGKFFHCQLWNKRFLFYVFFQWSLRQKMRNRKKELNWFPATRYDHSRIWTDSKCLKWILLWRSGALNGIHLFARAESGDNLVFLNVTSMKQTKKSENGGKVQTQFTLWSFMAFANWKCRQLKSKTWERRT